MGKEILNLEPKNLWKHFYSLTQIPRPSGQEAECIAFIKKFGDDLGLETEVDETGNLVIRKPATPGMENRKGIILQGHVDMVPQKNSDKEHDFSKDPIDAWIDGEWVKAKGTTLGADNGIGVASAMAVLEAKNIEHGPIEALFTIDEETGMTGAFGLKPGFFKGDILLNLDSEDEGELYIGCAGGINGSFTFSFQKESVPKSYQAYRIDVKGLKGGHSGLDINLGRGNSNKILFRFLYHAAGRHGLRISSFEGGNLRNAIPREAWAIVVVPDDKKEKFMTCFEKNVQKIKNELSFTEPDFIMTCSPAGIPEYVMDEKSQKAVINAIYACPNGVIRMSDAMPGLVETSTNLAIAKTENDKVMVKCLLRSSVDSAKDDLAGMMEALFDLAGAVCEFDGAYPGWKPNPNSPILKTMKEVYNSKFGKVPEVKAIHAGLECGLIGGVYPNLDMISFGPTMRHPHSPDEKVNIATVQKFWDFLVETLKNAPVK
ncbi:MAG: aminoacyl-histidine dipeptidase [Sphingobacteriales bacterium]|nr:aminoacyl-histidine dipeptidase [Sphingobacteriales bacterium]